jgi:Ca-activated chloride channel family protein
VNGTRPYTIKTRVSQTQDGKTLNVQEIEATDKYLVGKYFLEVLTLPRIYHEVTITQSSTQTIDVPAPGNFSYRAGTTIVAQLFVIRDNGTIDWVCNLDESARSGQWYLQPGSYRVVYRNKNLRSATFSVEKDFRIYSNKTTSINL